MDTYEGHSLLNYSNLKKIEFSLDNLQKDIKLHYNLNLIPEAIKTTGKGPDETALTRPLIKNSTKSVYLQ